MSSKLNRRTVLIFIDMLKYCLMYSDKLALFFVPSSKEIRELYKIIPEEISNNITINFINNILIFSNGSRLMIKTSKITVEGIKGLEIDIYEENGLTEYEVWLELKLRKRNGYSKRNS